MSIIPATQQQSQCVSRSNQHTYGVRRPCGRWVRVTHCISTHCETVCNLKDILFYNRLYFKQLYRPTLARIPYIKKTTRSQNRLEKQTNEQKVKIGNQDRQCIRTHRSQGRWVRVTNYISTSCKTVYHIEGILFCIYLTVSRL